MARRVVLLACVLLLVTSSSGCLGCGGDLDAPVAPSTLTARFPDDAPRVLDAAGAFTAIGEGFGVEADDARVARGGLAVVLPRAGEGAVRFALPSGFAVQVHERALRGEGALAGKAVAYPSESGASFWTAGADDFEEWLSLSAGIANGDQPVGLWDIEGARLQERDGTVELLDDAGVPRIRVQAPEAITASGARITPWLTVRGATIALFADAHGEAVLVDPTWTATTNLGTSRSDHSATRLPDGRVLVAGGVTYTKDCLFNGVHTSLASAEIFDPASAVWTAPPSMSTERYHHTATLLPNGKVLVAGGYSGACNPVALATTELFDPVTTTWTPAPSMAAARGYHSATLLPSGKVLVAGGFAAGALSSVEIYDPVANSWSPAAPLPAVRYVHVAALLLDGRLVVAAGNNAMNALATAAVYDPVANTWTPTASMFVGEYYRAGATMSDGRVLVTGGYNNTLGTWQKFAEIYTPATNAWTIATPMPILRAEHAMLLLGSGHVLVAGGETGPGMPAVTSELYDSTSGTWAAGGDTAAAKKRQTLTLLADGRVLMAGGITNFVTAKTAAIYSEGAGVGIACASGSDCASGFCADGVCCNAACAAGPCDACSVATGASQSGVCTLLTGPACSDGSACTSGDTCQNGACVGAPIVCAALDACHVAGACNPGTGVCSNPAKANGSACDDGSACTLGESCQGGLCGGGSAVICAAPDACHDPGVCAPGSGVCAFASKPDGSACSDGNACTTGDACQGGVCLGSAVACVSQGPCHVAGTCDPATGACDDPAAPDGTACSDGDACTQGDLCKAGVCGAGSAVGCVAKDECHDVGVCDGATGACSSPAKSDGAACSVGACTGGVCTAPDGGSGGVGGGGVGGGATTSASTTSGSGGGTTSGGGSATSGGGGATSGGGSATSGGGSATTTGAGGGTTTTTGTGGAATTSATSTTSGSSTGVSTSGGDAPAGPGGCGCSAARSPLTGGLWVSLGVVLAMRRRRGAFHRRSSLARR